MVDPNARDAQSEVVSDKTRLARIAELAAENERLRNMLDGYGKLDAELAIAERRIEALSRTGAVKEREDHIATLKAENDTLREDNKVLQTEACRAWGLMKETAERALAAKDAELAEAVQEIERLKNLVGDPEGTAAHAEAFLDRAERAEAKLAEANRALADIRREAIRCRGEQSYRNFASFATRRAREQGRENNG